MLFRITSYRKDVTAVLSNSSYVFFVSGSVPVLGSALAFDILLSYSF